MCSPPFCIGLVLPFVGSCDRKRESALYGVTFDWPSTTSAKTKTVDGLFFVKTPLLLKSVKKKY